MDNDLLVYYVSLQVPTLAPIPVKPPITLVYSRHLVSGDDLPIVLRKSKRQCVHPISSFYSYNHLSSHSCSFIASLDSISPLNTAREALSHSG